MHARLSIWRRPIEMRHRLMPGVCVLHVCDDVCFIRVARSRQRAATHNLSAQRAKRMWSHGGTNERTEHTHDLIHVVVHAFTWNIILVYNCFFPYEMRVWKLIRWEQLAKAVIA